MKKYILIIVLIIGSVFSFWFFYLKDKRERDLMAKGKELVEKVEEYKTKNHKLPGSLLDIGIIQNETTETQFNYEKRNNDHYVIWLGISAEDSKFYYSDTKKWENIYREIK